LPQGTRFVDVGMNFPLTPPDMVRLTVPGPPPPAGAAVGVDAAGAGVAVDAAGVDAVQVIVMGADSALTSPPLISETLAIKVWGAGGLPDETVRVHGEPGHER
jgi:hypothetical protein